MLRYQVGSELPRLVKSPVTKTQLVMYSGASGDFNPIHTVEEFAVNAGLGGVIAHGMLTMAFVGQMLTGAVGEEGTLEKFGVRFQEMVRPGDTVTCAGKVLHVEQVKGGQRIHCEVWAAISPGKVVAAGTATFRIPNSPVSAGGE